MKLKHIIEAKDAIVRLTEKRFTDYKKLREIVKLRKAVEAEFEFYCAQEKKAVDAQAKQERKAVTAAIRNQADDFQQIADDGALLVQTEHGVERIIAGDVSLRAADGGYAV